MLTLIYIHQDADVIKANALSDICGDLSIFLERSYILSPFKCECELAS